MIGFIAIGLSLAIWRIMGHKSQSFQAAAHLFVGWLLSAWWYIPDSLDGRRWFFFWVAVALTVVEVGCFVWFRFFQEKGEVK